MDEFNNLEFQHNKLLMALKKMEGRGKIVGALGIARKFHAGQKRDGGQDYFIHPVRIANCLIFELSIKEPDIITAAILHDVVEDTPFTLKEVEAKFGKRVAVLVEKLTRIKGEITKKEKFKKTLKESDEVRLLKSVDWLDNTRSTTLRKDRGERYFRHVREASEMYLPMAETVNDYLAAEIKKAIAKLPVIDK